MSAGAERTPWTDGFQLVLATVHKSETTLGDEAARDPVVTVSHRSRSTTFPAGTASWIGRIVMADGGSGKVSIAGVFPPDGADVAERLLLEFEPEHGPRIISEIICGCRMDLRKSNLSETPESLDVLARDRLATL